MVDTTGPSRTGIRSTRLFPRSPRRRFWTAVLASGLIAGITALPTVFTDRDMGIPEGADIADLNDINVAAGTFGPGERVNIHDPALGGNEQCLLCHAQQSATGDAAGVGPLWDPNAPLSHYQMYASSSMDMQVAAQPQGISLVCLSCHDGSVGSDKAHQGAPQIGSDLNSSHPISVTYQANMMKGYPVAANGTIAGVLPLYGPHADQVECTTCHAPHENNRRALLRMDNNDSALCQTCHNK